jgi:diguanylate cyclase
MKSRLIKAAFLMKYIKSAEVIVYFNYSFYQGEKLYLARNRDGNYFVHTTLIAAFLVAYAIFLLLFASSSVLAAGSAVFQVIGTAFPAYWTFQAYKSSNTALRLFWLHLSIAIIGYLIATILWNIQYFYVEVSSSLTLAADVVWNLMTIFYLLAFLQLIRKRPIEVTFYQMVYDAVIIIVAAASLSWEFLLHPLWDETNELGLFSQIIGLSYPVGDLIILFFVVSVFNALSFQYFSKVLLLICAGFIVFLIADTSYLYLLSEQSYFDGHLIDLLWIVGLVLVGSAAMYTKELDAVVFHKEPAADVSKSLFSFRLWFSTISVLLLLAVIVVRKDGFDLIALGCIVSTLLIMSRQMYTMFENRRLVLELEEKVLQRTEELLQKNKELENSTEQAKFLAGHDPLTGLPNRREFDRVAAEWAANSKNFALLFIDMDRFKWVNDTMNHGVGDLLLRQVAERLQANIKLEGRVFRQGGDEFLILLPSTDVRKVEAAVDELVQTLEQVFHLHGKEVFVSASVGISSYPKDAKDVELLTIKADIAMYAAKKSPGKRWLFYDESLHPVEQSKLEMEKEMRYGLERGEFLLHFQPLYRLDIDTVAGAEVLMRWNHPKQGLLPPNQFIPLAEESRFIVRLGNWLIREVCRQWHDWREQGYEPISLAVNISVNQFLHPEFVAELEAALREFDMDPAYLELEITENIPFCDAHAIAVLAHISQLGVRMSIDDFGTGYSSLQYIQRLPVHTLKIDRAFVYDMMQNRNNRVLVETILVMANQLELDVIAEGVEEQEQLHFLKEKGCTFVQGYLIGKPVAAEEFRLRWLG